MYLARYVLQVGTGLSIANDKGPDLFVGVVQHMGNGFQEKVMVLYRYQPADDTDGDHIILKSKLGTEGFPFFFLAGLKPVEIETQLNHPELFHRRDPEIK